MAYRQPGLTVTQDFEDAEPTLALFQLPNLNIGPAFQVVSLTQAGVYVGDDIVLDYPTQMEGTLVDTRAADPTDLISYPVAINLSQVVISYLTATTGAVSGTNLNLLSDATTNQFAKSLVGDVVIVTGSVDGNDGAYTIRALISANSVQVNESFTAAETGLNYTIRRNLQATIGNVSIPTSTTGVVVTQDNLELPIGMTYTHPTLGEQQILSANVLLSYRSQRLDMSAGLNTFTNTTDLQTAFGVTQIVPENPLAFAAFVALGNAAPSTDVLALDFQFLDNEVLSYSDAFSIIETDSFYVINVLTQNPSVHTELSAFVTAQSAPTAKNECVGIINRQLITTQIVIDEIDNGIVTGVSGGPYVTLNSAGATFLSDEVVPGMFVNITAPTEIAGNYPIASVVSQTQLLFASANAPSAAESDVEFTIQENLTLDQQAMTMAAYASSIGNRRIVMTWPDIVSLPAGNTVRPLPGYFLGCSVGALTTLLPTQQGFTNISVALYTGVTHSTKYFTNAQLNELASGGVMIFIQAILNVSALVIRQQLTTDLSSIKFQEYSITKNVDFIAMFIRQQQAPFIGKYNIVDNTFDALKTSASGIIKFLKNDTLQPKIGGVISSGSLTSIVQDPANIDGILEAFALNIPIPLNNLDVTLFV